MTRFISSASEGGEGGTRSASGNHGGRTAVACCGGGLGVPAPVPNAEGEAVVPTEAAGRTGAATGEAVDIKELEAGTAAAVHVLVEDAAADVVVAPVRLRPIRLKSRDKGNHTCGLRPSCGRELAFASDSLTPQPLLRGLGVVSSAHAGDHAGEHPTA
eukprot:4195868-Pleurochrysis_carterae.AAC.1